MDSNTSLESRKGATSKGKIPLEVLEALNRGDIATVNLIEWLAVDQEKLVKATLAEPFLSAALSAISKLKSSSALNCIKAIGEAIYETLSTTDNTILELLVHHKADIPRCWGTSCIGISKGGIVDKLDRIYPFAIDKHFGVREIAWLAIRDQLMQEINEALPILQKWTESKNAYQRRFAIESIRPKGVWCKQFKLMQEQPELALPLLDRLQKDPSRYVQDSVANWLNDASKSNPLFVKQVCMQWKEQHPEAKETSYIVKRATRSI